MNNQPAMAPVNLITLPRNTSAVVAAIDWSMLAAPEARRLRELGFDEGVGIEVLHRSTLSAGPIACRIGRMTVAMRRAVAAAIQVSATVHATMQGQRPKPTNGTLARA